MSMSNTVTVAINGVPQKLNSLTLHTGGATLNYYLSDPRKHYDAEPINSPCSLEENVSYDLTTEVMGVTDTASYVLTNKTLGYNAEMGSGYLNLSFKREAKACQMNSTNREEKFLLTRNEIELLKVFHSPNGWKSNEKIKLTNEDACVLYMLADKLFKMNAEIK